MTSRRGRANGGPRRPPLSGGRARRAETRTDAVLRAVLFGSLATFLLSSFYLVANLPSPAAPGPFAPPPSSAGGVRRRSPDAGRNGRREENSTSPSAGASGGGADSDSDSALQPHLIHVLETRFMQSQPDLVDLARARLRLLRSVCLPSVLGQSVWGQFLWVIRTDPDLDAEVRAELIELLASAGALAGGDGPEGEGRSLTYVVGSNDNYIVSNSTTLSPDVNPFDVRDMLEDALARPESIMAGGAESMRILLDEIAGDDGSLSPDDIVLWTRLDADDGLNVVYMEYIQTQAVRYFLPQNYDGQLLETLPGDDADDGNRTRVDNTYVPPEWTYWCSGRNLDWFVGSDDPARLHGNGTVYPVIHANVCVTPGITVAVRAGVDPAAVPRLDHDKIVSKLRVQGGNALCGRRGLAVFAPADAENDGDEDDGGDGADEDEPDDGTCFHMVAGGFSAVRSRTPTSAGMMGVQPDATQLAIVAAHPNIVPIMWNNLEINFGMNGADMTGTVSYFAENLYEIAEDNARGQCTKGHSCKTSSKDRLGQYVDVRVEGRGGLDVVDGTIVAGYGA